MNLNQHQIVTAEDVTLTNKYKLVPVVTFANARLIQVFNLADTTTQETTLDMVGATMYAKDEKLIIKGLTFYAEFTDNNTQMFDGSNAPISWNVDILLFDLNTALSS